MMPDWTDPRGPFNAARFGRRGLQLRAALRKGRLNVPLLRLGLSTGIEAALVQPHNTKGNNTMSNTTPLNAYAVKERGNGKKAIWTRIGGAWPHKASSGFTVELEALPLGGKIVLTPPKAEALVAGHAAERIRVKLEVFDWMLATKDKRATKSPPGYLVKSIEDDYAAPKGFETKANRAKREAMM